jgi:hypothetical protein
MEAFYYTATNTRTTTTGAGVAGALMSSCPHESPSPSTKLESKEARRNPGSPVGAAAGSLLLT